MGLKFYFTGTPCKRGHTAQRYTSIGKCKECSVIESKERRAREIAANPEKQRLKAEAAARKMDDPDRSKYFAKYRAENREECLLRSLKSRAKNRAAYAKKRRELRRKNRDEHIQKCRAYKEKTRDRVRDLERARRQRDPAKFRESVARRRAARKMATPAWADREAIIGIYREAAKAGCHVDHIVPLTSRLVCGLHCEANLQVLPGKENQSKGNRHWPDMP